MKNKLISIILCISLLSSIFSGIAQAGETESYQVLSYLPESFNGYYVFNNKTDIPAVAKAYMGGSYVSKFSVNSFIKSMKWNVSTDADRTQLSTYIGRADRSRGFAICYGGDLLPEVLLPAAGKGDLKIAAVMQGYADTHRNIKYHLSTKTTNVDFKLKETYSKVMTEYYSAGQRPAYMGWVSESQRVPIWYNMKPGYYFPYFDFTTLGCGDGGVHFNNISAMLKDSAGPTVKEIYPSGDGSVWNRRTTYRAGETVYFNVKFNENVKFSDDAPGKDKILKIKKKYIASNTEQSDTINATFYNLVSGNTMVFKYVVPEGENFEYYSDSIADWSQQTYLYSDEENFTYTDPVLSQVDQVSIDKYKLNRVKSCIVDIAGNPMEKNGSVTEMSAKAYMDNVKPLIQRVELEAVRGNDNQPGTKTYLKAGDQIVATAVFSEEIGLRLATPFGQVQRYSGVVEPLAAGELEATLNINGKSVNVKSSQILTGPDGARSGVIVTKASFPYTIKAGDVLDADRINISDLHLFNVEGSQLKHNATGIELTDARGNPFAATASSVVSAQQYELDNNAPAVVIENGPSPTYYPNQNNPCEFYYKVKVSDDNSGILGKNGLFSLDTLYTGASVYQDLQYSISDSPDKPSEYKSGKTGEKYSFAELPDGSYIHIKLTGQKSTGELCLNATGFDRNDNAASVTAFADKSNGARLIDMSAPDLNATYTIDSSKNYAVTITAKDESAVAKISYQWVTSDSAITVNGWSDEVNSTGSSSFTVNLTEATTDKSMNEKTLYIKAIDEFGNETGAPAGYAFQLDRLAAGAEITVEDFEPAVFKSEHDLKAKILDDNTVVHVEWKKVNQDGSEQGTGAEWSVVSANSIINNGASGIGITNYASRLAAGEDTFDIAKANAVAKFSQNSQGAESYGEDIGLFYGTYRVYITAARIIKDGNGDDKIVNQTESTYTLKIVGKDTVLQRDINLLPILPEGAAPNASLVYDNNYEYNYTGSDGDETLITNLTSTEGVQVKIDIYTASPYVEDIGIDYLDFEKSKYQVFQASYDQDWNKVLTQIYEKQLDATATQYMTIPDEVLSGSSKDYMVKVTLVDKSGNFTEKYINDITVDRRKIAACGPVAVRNSSGEGQPLAEYGITEGQAADAIYIGGNGASIEFTCAALKNELPGKVFFKLWSEDKKAEETSWILIPGGGPDTIDQNVYSTYSVRYLLPDDDLQLKTGENYLKYQFMIGNGEKSEIRDLKVYVDSTGPVLTLGCDNAAAEGSYYRTNQAVVPHIEALYDNLTQNDKLKVSIYAETEDGNGGYTELLPETAGGETVLDDKGFPVYRFTGNGTYEVAVTDQSGNVTERKLTIDWIDKEKPALQVSNSAINTDFNFEVKVSDGSNDAVNANGKSKFTVLMQYDKAYSDLLGENAIAENGEAQWFDITDTAKASFPGKLAVNSSVNSDGTTTYNLSGELAYDPDVAEGTNLQRKVSFKAVDIAGNESDISEVVINKKNNKPAIVSHGIEQGKYAVSFNTTVKLDSLSMNAKEAARKHTNVSIYENGTHKISFSDLFGNKYEGTITADIFEKSFRHGIAVSETLPTRENVDVELNTTITDGLYLLDSIAVKDAAGTAVPDAAIVKTDSDVAGAGTVCTGAKISLKSNAIITYTLKSIQTDTTQTFTIPVFNIDKTAPAAHIVYDYEAPIENGVTAGYVTAFLVSDEEEITVNSGTGQSHLFTAGNGESYTFEFEDQAGNKNSLEAKVDAIIKKTYFANDATPPDYSIRLSSMNINGVNKFAELSRQEYEQSIADPDFRLPYLSGKLLIDFNITDINKVTLSLKAPNSKVIVDGNMVLVNDNAEFTVLLTDANNNVTQADFDISTIDNQAPTGTVKYEALSDKSVRAYLTMTDNVSPADKLSILNTSGVEYDAQKGYYISFVDNSSSSFIISDEAGNVSFIPVAVAFIDKVPPNLNAVEWVPCKYTLDNKPLKDQLSDKKFNGNVTAFLVFSKPVKSAELLTVSEQSKIDLTIATKSLLVTIKENTSPVTIQIKVTDYSDNTKTVSLPPVDIIDKEGPVVISVTSNPSDTSALYKEVEYTFTLSENAYFTSEKFLPATPGEVPTAKNMFTKKITQNGQYALSFTDEAGNVTYYTLVVKNRIDTIPPSIMLRDVPATKQMIEDYNKTAATPAIHMLTNQNVTFEVSMSKKGTLLVNSSSYKVNANEKVQVIAPYNGIYSITAEDEAGYTTTAKAEIDCIDKVKPIISVPSLQTLEVKEDTSLAAFTANALSGVTAMDNSDGDVTAKLALPDITQQDLNTAGSYNFTYTVTDLAGNTASVTRRVKVYSDEGFNVFVNGKLAEKNNLIMATGERLNISTTLNSKLPVKLYYKMGIQTEGTMKSGATAFTGSFEVKKGRYYTIYIQTQDRVTCLTYVYVTE